MSIKEHQVHGSTAACVIRGVMASANLSSFPSENDQDPPNMNYEHPKKRLFFGDSWFGSVKAVSSVAQAGHHACMMVKTAHSRSPKKFLEDKMKDFPGGTWITLEATPEKEKIPLICIGYKYNKKKVLTFVMSRGAGKTTDGEPYEARFPDKYGNVCIRLVRRPAIISTFFKYSNCVDVHNQARQFDLALEKKWVTQDPYYRLYTTMVGMTVVDTWKMMKKKDANHSSITEFADVLAREMIDHVENELQDVPPDNVVTVEPEDTSMTTTSTLTVDTNMRHTKIFLTDKKQLRCIWCSRINLTERKTTMMCLQCGKGFCRDSSGFGCWSHHIALGGIPCAPKKGTKKRLAGEVDGEGGG